MTDTAGLLPDRHPMGDFFVCDLFGAAPKDDLGSMEHPIFSLSTRPDRRVLSHRRATELDHASLRTLLSPE